MRGLGSGVKEFQKGMNEVLNDKDADSDTKKEEQILKKRACQHIPDKGGVRDGLLIRWM